MTSKIRTIPPEDLSQELFPSGQKSKVIIGGPSIGKSHYLRNIEGILVISTFDDVEKRISNIPIVIDDFYICFKEYLDSEDKEKREIFEKLIKRERGVYLWLY